MPGAAVMLKMPQALPLITSANRDSHANAIAAEFLKGRYADAKCAGFILRDSTGSEDMPQRGRSFLMPQEAQWILVDFASGLEAGESEARDRVFLVGGQPVRLVFSALWETLAFPSDE